MEKMEEKLRRLAPVLTDKELQEINGLFTAYTFRRSKTRELWTTCCGKHKVIREERATAAERLALEAEHAPVPVYRWGRMTNEREAKRRIACPWCGKETIHKELQYTGQRKNLWEYRRAVVLRQWRGALWACAYDCFKDYGRELTHLPKVKLLGVYRFRPGKAEEISRTWYDEAPLHGYICQTAPGRGHKMWELSAPYGFCSEYGKGYEAVGLEELTKSVFRYCCIGDLQSGCDLIKLLTACCFYPRQIEWLGQTAFGERRGRSGESGREKCKDHSLGRTKLTGISAAADEGAAALPGGVPFVGCDHREPYHLAEAPGN